MSETQTEAEAKRDNVQAARTPPRPLLRALLRRLREGGSSPMPAARPMRTALRSAHLLAFGALYGGHVFGVDPARLFPALAAVLLSGGAFMLFEIWRTPVWLVQVRGVATYAKLGLLCCVPIFWAQRVWILSAIVVVGAVVSHMPSRYRYFSLLHGRVVHGGENG